MGYVSLESCGAAASFAGFSLYDRETFPRTPVGSRSRGWQRGQR